MNRRLLVSIFLVPVVLFSVSCASVTKSTISFSQPEISKNSPVIYFFRLDDFYGKAVGINVFYIDPAKKSVLYSGDKIASLKIGAYMYKKLEPGVNSFKIAYQGADATFDVTAAKNEQIFVLIKGKQYKMMNGPDVPAEIKNMKYDAGL